MTNISPATNSASSASASSASGASASGASASGPRQTLATLVGRQEVTPHHFLLALHAPYLASRAQAGQFVHILPRDGTSSEPFLRRAFSIMCAQDEQIEVLFRVVGRGTQRLSQAMVGDRLDVLGPLGLPFDLTPFHVKQSLAPIPILVGGGIGVPPLVFLASTLTSMGIKPTVFVGARTQSEIIGEPQLGKLSIEARITTDDGSRGRRGFITARLEATLAELAKQKEAGAIIYSCGPTAMLQAVAQVAERADAPCQVSLEENMPCGIGVCNGCVVAMRAPSSNYERYQRVCVHGPAMWADEIDWEAL